MLIISPSTATALASHATSKSWVMFVQANLPSSCNGQGLILIEGARGNELAARIKAYSSVNAYELTLIGLIETPRPAEHAQAIAAQYTQHVHDNWYEATASLIAFIQHVAQPQMIALLNETHPGALSEQPVDIDEIASMLGVSVQTIRRMIARGQIPCFKAGKGYRFVPADVIGSLRRAR